MHYVCIIVLFSCLKVTATDADVGENAQIIFTLDGRDSAYFTVGPSSGILRATHVFDYESQREFEFNVVATDMGSPARGSSANIQISIMDTNDHSPTFNQTTYEFWLEENQSNGSFVGIVKATDMDSILYNEFVYSFSPSNWFTIDGETGIIRSKRPLDREVTMTHYLTVYATNLQGQGTSLRGEATVVIQVSDLNDNWPVIIYPSDSNQTVYVSSGVPVGYDILIIQALDVDEGWNSELVYTLTGGRNQDLFTVDYSTGIISTITRLDEYNDMVLELVIGVSDQGVPSSHISTSIMKVHVNDSVPFYTTDGAKDNNLLLQGTHLNVVIALSVVSAGIVVILVVAIVLVKRQDRNKRSSVNKERTQSVKV